METALKGLRLEAVKSDLFEDYHKLSFMIQKIRRENEIIDKKVKKITKNISKN